MPLMSDPVSSMPSSGPAPPEGIYPTLTSAQIARVAAPGRVRMVQPGDVLVEPGDTNVPFFVV